MADLELNSIGNGDGNNYLVRDNTKIPLSGTYNITGTDFFKETNTSSIVISGGHAWNTGAYLGLSGGAKSENPGSFTLHACKTDGIYYRLIGYPNGTLTWGSKNVAMQEDTVPRSGGAVLTNDSIGRTVNTNRMVYCGGTDVNNGACLKLYGKDSSSMPGEVIIQVYNGTNEHNMRLCPNSTWTWTGTAVQLISDQRLKQQITEIDDKLLDAWQDVNPVQFKYNDAVEEKSDNARLHTGYVVQQIDEACKKHNVDVSKYGLYCHEEYPEETEEVEVEQEDGTKTKERKVIREASEHYSLRYTEALIVECAYLRKKNKDLQEQLNALSERLEKLENR